MRDRAPAANPQLFGNNPPAKPQPSQLSLTETHRLQLDHRSSWCLHCIVGQVSFGDYAKWSRHRSFM